MNTIKNIDVETDYAFLVKISKRKLEELGALEEYIQKRGGDNFCEDGYDYITILQAKLIGIIK